MKNITIFGKGNMAKVIAERFKRAGSEVTLFGSKDEVTKDFLITKEWLWLVSRLK